MASLNPGVKERTDGKVYPESIACGQRRVIIGDGDKIFCNKEKNECSPCTGNIPPVR